MSTFTPTSLITLAKWTRYSGTAVLILFVARLILDTTVVPASESGVELLLRIDLILFLLPGVGMLVIARWVEEGRLWAVLATCALSICASWGSVMRMFFTGYLSMGMAAVFLRTWAAVFIAWPDLHDLRRARKRQRMQPQGFQVVMPEQSRAVATPVPAIPLRSGDGLAKPLAITPRFIPESLRKAAGFIRGVGIVMLIVFALIFAFSASFVSVSDGVVPFARPSFVWFAAIFVTPAIVYVCLPRWIEIGRRWAVIALAATALTIVCVGWLGAVLLPEPSSGPSIAVIGVIASLPSAFVLILCAYMWRDVREISRSMARDRLYAQRSVQAPPAAVRAAPGPARQSQSSRNRDEKRA